MSIEKQEICERAEHHHIPENKNKKGEREITVHGDQAEQTYSEVMQPGREGNADQAKQASSRESEQLVCDQAEHLMSRERQMIWVQAELKCSAERGEMGQAEPGCRSYMSDRDDDQQAGRNRGWSIDQA